MVAGRSFRHAGAPPHAAPRIGRLAAIRGRQEGRRPGRRSKIKKRFHEDAQLSARAAMTGSRWGKEEHERLLEKAELVVPFREQALLSGGGVA